MALAPWCAAERWEFWSEGDKRFARVTGRQPCPVDLKNSLSWWLRNDYEQSLAEAPWFEPDKPQDQRERDWALRNPLQNARLFVFGCADRNYTVEVLEGNPDPMVIQRDDVGELGYQKARLFNFEDKSPDRFFTSYCNAHVVWQWGCQPNGFYGLKFTVR